VSGRLTTRVLTALRYIRMRFTNTYLVALTRLARGRVTKI
jgi:hypothetical protein